VGKIVTTYNIDFCRRKKVALPLIDTIIALDVNMVAIRFGRTIKINSLKNQNFIVQTNSATPSVVTNPFLDIQTIVDYNQVSRTLKLYWDTEANLNTNTEYLIRLVNFIDAVNESIPEEQISFTWKGDDATPSSFSSVKAPDPSEILVEDKSIRTDAYTSIQILAKNPEFYISDIIPKNGDFYIENDFNLGRAKITFNARPASNFLNNTFFKCQRKKIQRTPSRWENISTNVQLHSWKPEVYIDFPSLNDATPSYNIEDKEYFESGYKYRIIVSKNVGV
jgi:hypothetical protein